MLKRQKINLPFVHAKNFDITKEVEVPEGQQVKSVTMKQVCFTVVPDRDYYDKYTIEVCFKAVIDIQFTLSENGTVIEKCPLIRTKNGKYKDMNLTVIPEQRLNYTVTGPDIYGYKKGDYDYLKLTNKFEFWKHPGDVGWDCLTENMIFEVECEVDLF